MAEELFNTIEGFATLEDGKMMKCMVEVKRNGLTVQYLQEYLKRDRKFKENLIGPMETNIKDNLQIIKCRDSGNIHGVMGGHIRDIGKIV